jgi:hypothetical protein
MVKERKYGFMEFLSQPKVFITLLAYSVFYSTILLMDVGEPKDVSSDRIAESVVEAVDPKEEHKGAPHYILEFNNTYIVLGWSAWMTDVVHPDRTRVNIASIVRYFIMFITELSIV